MRDVPWYVQEPVSEERLHFFAQKPNRQHPRFINLRQQDFRLQPDSPAFSLGFKQIPVGKLGLYTDEFRNNRLP